MVSWKPLIVGVIFYSSVFSSSQFYVLSPRKCFYFFTCIHCSFHCCILNIMLVMTFRISFLKPYFPILLQQGTHNIRMYNDKFKRVFQHWRAIHIKACCWKSIRHSTVHPSAMIYMSELASWILVPNCWFIFIL